MNTFSLPYTIQELYQNTWCITDPGIGIGSVNLYLLVGHKRALLIDSGYGVLDLPQIISGITDKEVVCVCTHGHIDHALGARHFRESYLHERDVEVYHRHTSSDFIRRIGLSKDQLTQQDIIRANPWHSKIVETVVSVRYPELLPIPDEGEIDLGNRKVAWRLLAGHTQGSLVFTDEQNHTVFDSDAAPNGAWLFLPESSPLSVYMKELEEYHRYLTERQIIARYTGHSPSASTISDLEQLMAVCQNAASNPGQGIAFETLFGRTRIFMTDQNVAIFAPDT